MTVHRSPAKLTAPPRAHQDKVKRYLRFSLDKNERARLKKGVNSVNFYKRVLNKGEGEHNRVYANTKTAHIKGGRFKFNLVAKVVYSFGDDQSRFDVKTNKGRYLAGTVLTYKWVATVDRKKWFATKKTMACYLFHPRVRIGHRTFKLSHKEITTCFRTMRSKKQLAACKRAAHFVFEHPCGGWGEGKTGIMQKCWDRKQKNPNMCAHNWFLRRCSRTCIGKGNDHKSMGPAAGIHKSEHLRKAWTARLGKKKAAALFKRLADRAQQHTMFFQNLLAVQ